MSRQEQGRFCAIGATGDSSAARVDRPRVFSWWSAPASVVLHGAIFCLIMAGGSGGPVGLAGAGGGQVVLEVGLLSLPGGLGQGADEQTRTQPDDSLPPQEQQAEAPAPPDDAIPLRTEQPKKNRPQAAREKRSEQARQKPSSEAQEESASRTGAGETRADGNGSGAAAGDGRPFGFSLGDVSGKPKVIQSVPVVYPVEARKRGINGQVLVRFHLDEKGAVSHLHVKSAEPPDIFNRNTLAAVRQWRFQPAVHNSRAVPVWVELPIEFALR
ncbi:MAG: energy transducer TonB [Deltaproteobacteria bacterium]|nr:energy transducer TonB [Deltaproteobacteria bacterium]